MDEVKQIVSDIANGRVYPIYFLTGEEPYYIDQIASYIEKNVLREEEKSFNQMVLYGKEVSVDDILTNAKRYPMMAERQVIIIKEAQHLARNIDKLVDYAKNPQLTTVLVFCYKYSKFDKRKKLFKLLKEKGVFYESKKIYEDKVHYWITRVLKDAGYSITTKASMLLVEHLGNDLSKISKELEKLKLVLSKDKEITPLDIEKNIGISKDHNNFELNKAIGARDIVKATRIINYFAQNPKDNPIVLTISLLHGFFTKLLKYHSLTDLNPKTVSKTLGINPYFVEEYRIAAKNYPMKKVSRIISILRELDLKGKGVGVSNVSQGDLLKELLVKII